MKRIGKNILMFLAVLAVSGIFTVVGADKLVCTVYKCPVFDNDFAAVIVNCSVNCIISMRYSHGRRHAFAETYWQTYDRKGYKKARRNSNYMLLPIMF